MTSRHQVAVTGAGCLCGAGATLPQCVESTLSGVRSPAPPSRFSIDRPTLYPVFEVPEHFFPKHVPESDRELRTSRLAVAAALESLNDAGWDLQDLKKLRVGICIGTTVGSAMNNEEFYQQYRSGSAPSISPIRRFFNSNPAASIARHIGTNGPLQTVVNACSSGTDAIGLAASWIRSGLCDVALAGGADELCRVTYSGFISLMITDNAPVRPFDRDRKGLNLGEGAAILVLESERVRKAGGREPRSMILGYGSSCDAHHLTAPSPTGSGLEKALDEAFRASDVKAAALAFVNAHGTGTPDNDRVESQILDRVLPRIPFFSTKGYTGHTLGAAGAIEAALTMTYLKEGRIPGNIGFECSDEQVPTAPVIETTSVDGNVAATQSLGFGGNNAVLVFGKV